MNIGVFRKAGGWRLLPVLWLCCGLGWGLSWPAAAAPPVIQVGVLGPLSGDSPSALLSRQCAETTAQMYNDQGGLLVGRDRYRIEVVAYDTKGQAPLAMQGERELAAKGVHYFIGPFTPLSGRNIVAVSEIAGAVNIAYADEARLYTPPRRYAVYGEVPAAQRIAVLYEYLASTGVHSLTFLARNDETSLSHRGLGIAAARAAGIELSEPTATVIDEITYGAGSSPKLDELLERYAALKTDAIVLTDVRPKDVVALVKGLREEGYQGRLVTDWALPANTLKEAGRTAEGFIAPGVTPGVESWSDYRSEFARRFRATHGELPDEAGSRVYAMEFILRMIQAAGPSALTNTRDFRKRMRELALADPFFKTERELKLVGRAAYGQNAQLNVPVVVKEIYDGQYQTRFVHDPS